MLNISQNQEGHRLWLAMRMGLGAAAFPDTVRTLAVDNDGHTLAVALFRGYQQFPNGRCICTMTVAALPQVVWLTRPVIKAMMALPFDDLGVSVLQTACSRRNMQARRFFERLGFKRAGITRRGFDGKYDLVFYDMLSHESARWLGYEPTYLPGPPQKARAAE